MNFEHLCSLFTQNWTKIKNKKKALFFLKENYRILKLKKQKLKLGLISFEIKEFKIPNTSYILFETIDIKFIKQDTIDEDEQKFENRLKRLNVKKKKILYFFLFLLFIFLIYFIILNFIYFIENQYMHPAIKNSILKHILFSLFPENPLLNFLFFNKKLNEFLIDSIFNLSSIYKFLL